MAQGRTQDGRTSNRGFASMDAERQREIASMGGKAVPDSKRSFSQNRRLAAEAGRKGGQSVPGSKRSFSQNRSLAAEAPARPAIFSRALENFAIRRAEATGRDGAAR